MSRTILLLASLFFVSCKTEDQTDRRKFVRESHRLAWSALKDKIARLAPEYATGKDGADVIARAIVTICEREVREVVICAVDVDALSYSGRQVHRESALLAYRRAEDESVRRDAADYAIAVIVQIRGDKSQGGKE